MKRINRSAAIVRPTKHFAEWANIHSCEGREFPLEYFREHTSLVVLIPYYDLTVRKQAKRYVHFIYGKIFEKQLRRWNPDENTWPKDRSPKIFDRWFVVEFLYDVVDSVV